jgi:signal transduction histidine kinase/DNA-binding response OmpR family regulator
MSAAVLIVDDDASKRLALKSILLPLGYAIVEADSGIAALRCLLVQDFAVILLDVRMPAMDGFETAALIRLRPRSEMTPIIFITAYSRDEIGDGNRFAEGAVDFIFAPVAAVELRAKVAVFANLFIKAAELAERATEVQASADQLRLLTDAAPIGIFQTDSDGRFVYTNPRWAEITGTSSASALGQLWDGATGRIEICVPDSPVRVAMVTSQEVRGGNGAITGSVGTLADITAAAGAEAALSAAHDEARATTRLKSDFLANMSHEIRTPMNGVLGMTDLLLETDLDPRQRDYAQTVRNSGEALLTIINDILDLSKLEAGKVELEDVEFDPQGLADEVVNLLARAAQAKGLAVIAAVGGPLPCLVTADQGRIRQILTNLLGNAIKFTHTGEVVVRAFYDDAPAAGTMLRFEISDTGDGIAEEKLASIFQPFVQSDTSTSRRYGGTGLGLAISGQLAELLGGEIGVTSTLGTGSTFWFTVRVASAKQAAAPSAERELAGVAVLVVDHNVTQREVTTQYLRTWGVWVQWASTGLEALARLRTAAIQGRPYAVALVDRSLVGMDGVELRDAVALDPNVNAEVVLVTDQGQEDLGRTAGAGLGLSLSKPIKQEHLRSCLRQAVGLGVRAREASPISPHVTEVRGGPTRRLLLVEDNLINRKVALAMLALGGYEVDAVVNGEEAVAAAAARRYDAILMDIQMPVLNGYEATAAIRANEVDGRHTPIIALTAGATGEDRARCLAAGMDDYLVKPMKKDALLAIVDRCVCMSLSNH